MANPGMPGTDPVPGGNIPSEVPPAPTPDELPDVGPTGPRTPYPLTIQASRTRKVPAPSPTTCRAHRRIRGPASEGSARRVPPAFARSVGAVKRRLRQIFRIA